MSSALRRYVFAFALGFVACAPATDRERQVPERGSLGRELYGALCDRVGAQSLREDVTGASYHDVCHPDSEGGYASLVDRSALPPLTQGAAQKNGEVVSIATQQRGRERNIARIEVLSEERDPLVVALDAMLPDLTLSPTRCAGQADGASLQTALRDSLSKLMPLVDDGTIPNVTRALGQLLRNAQQEPDLSRALSRLDARKGYRPEALALYVLGPVLSYPRLFELGGALAAVHREDRNGAKRALATLLRQAGTDLTASANEPLLPERELEVSREILSGRTRVSRPRTLRELSLDLLSAPALVEREALISVVRRDPRGLAQVLTAQGTLPWPFMEDDAGKPAVDELGRFITRDGQPAPQPFAPWSGAGVGRDALGRALSAEGTPLYAYLDVSGSVFNNLSTKLAPLVRPRAHGGEEALLDARVLEGALLGPRVTQADGVRLNADRAPLVDIMHALASALVRPELDDALQLFSKLARERADLWPRMVRLGLSLDAIADRYPDVALPPDSTLWDELIDVLVDMSKKGTLLEDLLDAFADPRTEQLGHVFAAYMRYSDDITYFRDPKDPENRDSLNGKAWNATTGDFSDLQTPVDRSLPDSGTNRSVLQRFLQLLHDANGLPACSKEGAVAHVDITWPPGGAGIPIRLDYPTSPLAKTVCAFLGSRAPSRIPECGILRFENVAEMLIGVAIGETEISVRDDCLNKLVSSPLAGLVGGANSFLQETSGIDGFSLEPTVPGVARLAFFDAPYSAWGGYAGEVYYPKTSRFLADVIDPVPSMVCPAEPYTDPIDGKVLAMRRCGRFEDTLRGRDPNGLFPLEQLDFLPLVQPLAKAFGKHQANGSFVALLDVLHRHWGSSRQTQQECDPTLPATEARHCTQDGVVAYEPMIAAMLDEGELFAELGTMVRAFRFAQVTHCDAFEGSRCTASSERDGIRVLAEAVRALADPARNSHLTDRRGEHRSRRNDGTFNPQTTPLSLALDALSHLDEHWRARPREHSKWLGARSTIIDHLAAVAGSREHPRFSLQALDVALPVAFDLLREQVAAHCSLDRADGRCAWAERELAVDVGRWLEEPLTASLFETLDALLADDEARRELGLFAATLLEGAPDASLATGIQAALIDVLQVLDDDASMKPLMGLFGRALAGAKHDDVALAPAVLELLSRFFDARGGSGCTELDPHHVFAFALKRAVQPINPGERAPLQVLLDAAYRVNRVDPRSQTSFLPEDFESLGRELSDLMLDEQSGLEQIYAILRQATASPP